jgi:hypothetical protein
MVRGTGRRFLVPAIVLLAGAGAGGGALAAPPMRFASVSVELPSSDRMFPGASNAAAINNDCLACHSAGMVLNQPALSKAQWAAAVHKMIGVFKAPVPPEDVAPIIDYLAHLKPGP